MTPRMRQWFLLAGIVVTLLALVMVIASGYARS